MKQFHILKNIINSILKKVNKLNNDIILLLKKNEIKINLNKFKYK